MSRELQRTRRAYGRAEFDKMLTHNTVYKRLIDGWADKPDLDG